jgi:hypothetical protein
MADQDISLCQYTPWVEVRREYVSNVTQDLPVNAPWRYKLTINYNKLKKRITGTFLTFGDAGQYVEVIAPPALTTANAEIQSLELKDGVKGALVEGFHYIVIGDGTVYFNGSYPYSHLQMTIKWIDKRDAAKRIQTFTADNVAILLGSGENKFRKRSTIQTWNVSYLVNAEGKGTPKNLKDMASYLKSTPALIRNINSNSFWKSEGYIYEVVRRGVTETVDDWKIFIEIIPGIINDNTGLNKYKFLDTKNKAVEYSKILQYFNMSDEQFKSSFTFNPINTKWQEIIDAQRIVKMPNDFEYVHKIASVSYKLSGKKDTFALPSSDSVDLPDGAKLFVEFPNQRRPIPHKPCFDGEEVYYDIDESYRVFYEKKCINDTTVTRSIPDPTIPAAIKFIDIDSDECNTLRNRLTQIDDQIKQQEQAIQDLNFSSPGDAEVQIIQFNATLDNLRNQYSQIYVDTQTRCRRRVSDITPQYLLPGISVVSDPVGSPWAVYGSSSLEVVTKSITEYVNHARNEALPDCDCIEFSIIGDSVPTQFAQCGCRLIQREKFYKVCPDEVLETIYDQYYNGRRTPLVANDLVPRLRENLSSDPLTGSRSPLNPVADIIIRSDKCPDPLLFRTDRTYHKFPSGSILTTNHHSIAGNLFGLSETGSCYFTSSAQTTSSKDYYYNVVGCQSCDSNPYFAVSYGNKNGSGSKYIGVDPSDTISRSIYAQYNLLTKTSTSENSLYYYYTGSKVESEQIYVLNFYREHLEEKLSPGNFQINLAELNGKSYSNSSYTGSNVQISSSNKVIHLIDNSNNVNQEYDGLDVDPYISFDIVSGSISYGIHNSGTGSILTNPNITTYGKVYPNLGVVVLDANMLNEYTNFNTVTGSDVNGDNSYKMFLSISGSNNLNNPMIVRNVKSRSVKTYLVQVPVTEANYSNNPTFVSNIRRTGPGKGLRFAQQGILRYGCFDNNPVVYITTIGLYNDNKELLAIAKLSKPIKKTFQTQLNIKIRLGL